MNVVTRRFRAVPYGDSYACEFRQQPDGHFDIYCTEHAPCHDDANPTRCHQPLLPHGRTAHQPRDFGCNNLPISRGADQAALRNTPEN